MSDFNKNFLFPDSNPFTQFPGDAEKSQLNQTKENSPYNHGYDLVNYSSNDANNAQNDVYPMLQPPSDLNIFENFGGSNIPNNFPPGEFSTNFPIDNTLQNDQPPNQDFSEPFYINSHKKDDYSLSYIVSSAMEICSSMNNSTGGGSGSVTTMAAENTTIGQLIPQGQFGTSIIGYNQSYNYSNVVETSQNHPNEMSFPRNEGTYSRNCHLMETYQGGNSISTDEGCYFTVLNSQDHLPATLPQVTSGGGTTRGGPIEAGRQASSLRNYQLLPQGTSSNQRFNRVSRSSSDSDYRRWGGRPLRSSFEIDYQDWQARSKRGRSWRDETRPQINPFSTGAQYSYLQPRVPFSVGLTRKLQNPCGDNHSDHTTSTRNLSSWRSKNIITNNAFDSRQSLQVEEHTGSKTAMPQSHPSLSRSLSIRDGGILYNNVDSNSISTIGSSRNVNNGGDMINSVTAKISSGVNGDESQEKAGDAKGKAKADDVKGNGGEGHDEVSGDEKNPHAQEDDDFNFTDASEHFLVTKDRFGFDV